MTEAQTPVLDYKFPILNNLQQVKDVIGDNKFFAITNRGEHTFVGYKLVTKDSFPAIYHGSSAEDAYVASVRRELRGLVFNSETGDIVSRPLHKFFNLGERPDTSIENVAELLTRTRAEGHPVHVLDKLDGSLVTPIYCTSGGKRIKYRTKMSYEHDVSKHAENFIRSVDKEGEHNKYDTFSKKWLDDGFTPMFEFFSPETAIVINYKTSFMTLIAIRNVHDGTYISYNDMIQFAKDYNIPCVTALEFTVDNTASDLLTMIKSMTDKEGCVMRFHDGTMIKIKTDWYSSLHHLKSSLSFQRGNKDVLEMIVNNQVDDSVAVLNTQKEKDDLLGYNDLVQNAILKCASELEEGYKSILNEHGAGAGFAQYIKKNNEMSSLKKSLLFTFKKLSTTDIDSVELLTQEIKKLLNKQHKQVLALLNIPGYFTETEEAPNQ
ncbi:T4 RNA ligase [Acrasis kona]|uniref:T4 RNA ligase n=1 Tax=Acrasis kona TaxID=1008807 RepID=A0AAW2YIS0_9EUKA